MEHIVWPDQPISTALALVQAVVNGTHECFSVTGSTSTLECLSILALELAHTLGKARKESYFSDARCASFPSRESLRKLEPRTEVTSL